MTGNVGRTVTIATVLNVVVTVTVTVDETAIEIEIVIEIEIGTEEIEIGTEEIETETEIELANIVNIVNTVSIVIVTVTVTGTGTVTVTVTRTEMLIPEERSNGKDLVKETQHVNIEFVTETEGIHEKSKDLFSRQLPPTRPNLANPLLPRMKQP